MNDSLLMHSIYIKAYSERINSEGVPILLGTPSDIYALPRPIPLGICLCFNGEVLIGGEAGGRTSYCSTLPWLKANKDELIGTQNRNRRVV